MRLGDAVARRNDGSNLKAVVAADLGKMLVAVSRVAAIHGNPSSSMHAKVVCLKLDEVGAITNADKGPGRQHVFSAICDVNLASFGAFLTGRVASVGHQEDIPA